MEPDVEAYLLRLIASLEAELGDDLSAVWLGGSVATADFRVATSDLDVFVISRRSVPVETKIRLADVLRHASLPCPAHGLDLLAYRTQEVRDVQRAPMYEFSLASGREWSDEVSMGGRYPAGIIDLALLRQSGHSLRGAEPEREIGTIPESWVLEELATGLRWHFDKVHDPFHDPTGSNAVLNACRAQYFLAERAFVSKTTGGEWSYATDPVPVVLAALTERANGGSARLDRAEVIEFLDASIQRFSQCTS